MQYLLARNVALRIGTTQIPRLIFMLFRFHEPITPCYDLPSDHLPTHIFKLILTDIYLRLYISPPKHTHTIKKTTYSELKHSAHRK